MPHRWCGNVLLSGALKEDIDGNQSMYLISVWTAVVFDAGPLGHALSDCSDPRASERSPEERSKSALCAAVGVGHPPVSPTCDLCAADERGCQQNLHLPWAHGAPRFPPLLTFRV